MPFLQLAKRKCLAINNRCTGQGGLEFSGGLAELAAVMMGASQRRVDVISENVANMSTPAFRSRRVFSQVFDARQALPVDFVALDADNGASLKATGNPLDIATDVDTSLSLRSGSEFVQTRSAQLHQTDQGLLVDSLGRVLQADGGGDLNVGTGTAQILKDGTVLVGGQAVGKVGLFKADEARGGTEGRSHTERATGGHLKSARPAQNGTLRTGMLVSADVDLGAEMVD